MSQKQQLRDKFSACIRQEKYAGYMVALHIAGSPLYTP